VIEGSGLVEEEHGRRVPNECTINKIEMVSIAMALRDLERLGTKKIRICSDSLVGLEMIRDMKREGDSAKLWELLTNRMNLGDNVLLEWIPAH